jgi:hypothetical protein
MAVEIKKLAGVFEDFQKIFLLTGKVNFDRKFKNEDKPNCFGNKYLMI